MVTVLVVFTSEVMYKTILPTEVCLPYPNQKSVPLLDEPWAKIFCPKERKHRKKLNITKRNFDLFINSL
jgi:hypothetical protein